jgi:hypothetical protein
MNNLRKSMMNKEQQIAYARFIKARDRIRHSKNWIPAKDYICTVDIVGMNHPLFELNEPYIEYQEAFKQWLAVEPEYRKSERMSMIRGDYDKQDSWRTKDGK